MSATSSSIERSEKYRELVSRRSRLGWSLSALMMAIYFGYILLVAYGKPLLATPVGSGVLTLGVLLSLAAIVFAILLTGFYVRVANSTFDALTRDLVGGAK